MRRTAEKSVSSGVITRSRATVPMLFLRYHCDVFDRSGQQYRGPLYFSLALAKSNRSEGQCGTLTWISCDYLLAQAGQYIYPHFHSMLNILKSLVVCVLAWNSFPILKILCWFDWILIIRVNHSSFMNERNTWTTELPQNLNLIKDFPAL